MPFGLPSHIVVGFLSIALVNEMICLTVIFLLQWALDRSSLLLAKSVNPSLSKYSMPCFQKFRRVKIGEGLENIIVSLQGKHKILYTMLEESCFIGPNFHLRFCFL